MNFCESVGVNGYLYKSVLFILLMIIRTATLDDFEELYRLGSQTKEFRVSANESFMDEDEFKLRITSGENVFLVAEMGSKIVGFVLFGFNDKDRLLKNRYR